MNLSRKEFFGFLGMGAAAAALPGCVCAPRAYKGAKGKIALQLYALNRYIYRADAKAEPNKPLVGVGLERALDNIAAIGYKGVEFYNGDCFGHDPKAVRTMLRNAGLEACGIHVDNRQYGFDTKKWTFDPEVLKKTCDFNLAFGNNLIICPGGGNFPPGVTWSTGQGGEPTPPSPEIDDFAKRLVDLYNQGAAVAAKYGCRIGLHNHTWEHLVSLQDGTSFWDYFFTNTDPAVCMEQDVGWSTCAGVDPKEQYEKYPHRSPTLHAKENGMGKDVKTFDAVLGKPGEPGATPVDWDGLIPVSEADGVEWYVVECERHFDDLSAVTPSYWFLKTKGLN